MTTVLGKAVNADWGSRRLEFTWPCQIVLCQLDFSHPWALNIQEIAPFTRCCNFHKQYCRSTKFIFCCEYQTPLPFMILGSFWTPIVVQSSKPFPPAIQIELSPKLSSTVDTRAWSLLIDLHCWQAIFSQPYIFDAAISFRLFSKPTNFRLIHFSFLPHSCGFHVKLFADTHRRKLLLRGLSCQGSLGQWLECAAHSMAHTQGAEKYHPRNCLCLGHWANWQQKWFYKNPFHTMNNVAISLLVIASWFEACVRHLQRPIKLFFHHQYSCIHKASGKNFDRLVRFLDIPDFGAAISDTSIHRYSAVADLITFQNQEQLSPILSCFI